jgi:hypothetical protein
VHFADAVLLERQVPVVIEQPGFDPGDMGGEPLAVGEGNELVLLAVHEQDGNADVGHLEPPRVDLGVGVVEPSLAARRERLVIGEGGVLGQLPRQDGRICGRQERGE